MNGQPPSKHDTAALRHIFTQADKGRARGGGYQTVAATAKLTAAHISAIEKLVESYHTESGDEPVCRQLFRLDVIHAYAFTVFTSLPPGDDKRGGNYWAETLVVPALWLEDGQCDVAAAFAALPWWGPRPLEEVRDLPVERLAPLQPGPLERLARIPQLTAGTALQPLLLAVVQQSGGLQAVRLLERDATHPEELDELIMLLPLVVPPACRLYHEGGEKRCLNLRTRSPAGGMGPLADVTGYAKSSVDGDMGGIVVDLAGESRQPAHGERLGYHYVRWLIETIEKRDWQLLAQAFERAARSPGATFFSTFSSLLPQLRQGARQDPPATPTVSTSDDAGPAATTPAPQRAAESHVVPPPLQAREAAWNEGDAAEAAIWRAAESHRRQLARLVDTLRGELEAEFAERQSDLKRDLAAVRKKLTDQFETTAERARQEGETIDGVVKPLQKRWKDLARKVGALETRVQALESQRPTAAGKRATAETPAAELSAADEPPGPELLAESEESPTQPWRTGLRRWWARYFEEGGALRRGRLATAIGLLLAVVAAGWWWLARRPDAPTVPSASEPAPVDAPSAAQLIEQARAGAIAARFLYAAGAKATDAAPKALLATLALALENGAVADAGVECALLQTLLAKEADVRVDGDCGRRTLDTLAEQAKNTCCRGFVADAAGQRPPELRHCALGVYFGFAQGADASACTGRSPWESRPWPPSAAARALALVREGAAAAQTNGKADLAAKLRDLDPAASRRPLDVVAKTTLSPPAAADVLALLWESAGHSPSPVDELDDDERRELAALMSATRR